MTWQKDIVAVERKLNGLLDLHIGGDIAKDAYVKKKNQLLSERDAIKEKLHDGESSSDQARERTENFFDTAYAAYSEFKTGDLDRMKAIVKQIGWKLELRDGILKWEYKKPFEFLVERERVKVSVGSPVLALPKTKNTPAFAGELFWRTGRDSNPRPPP